MRKKQQRQPGLRVWLAAFIFVGSFISGLVWLSVHSHSEEQDEKPLQVVEKRTSATLKPRFEFYNVLPKAEVAVDSKDKSLLPLSQYILQVAAVQRYQDADKLKAELVLQGFDVRLDRLKTRRGVLYRVSVGPFDSLHQAERSQIKLRKQRYQGIVKRVA